MNILKEGKEVFLKGVCNYCQCIVSAELKEWKKGPFMTKYFSIKCPNKSCQQEITALP